MEINNESYIRWGKLVFEKASNIYKSQLEHRQVGLSIKNELLKMYKWDENNPMSENNPNLFQIRFRAFDHQVFNMPSSEQPNGYKFKFVVPGVKVYWLNYINYFLDYHLSESRAKVISSICDRSISHDDIIDKIQREDFDFNYSGKFQVTYRGVKNEIILQVLRKHNLVVVQYIIKFIEAISNAKITKIALSPIEQGSPGYSHGGWDDILICLDDSSPNKFLLPIVEKETIFNQKFKSVENWYYELDWQND